MLPPYLTKPRWLIGHVLVLAVVVACTNLGFWQLRRLHERQAHNATVRTRSAETVALPEDGWHGGDLEELTYRRVALSGTYDTAGEVLVRFRSRLGLPGYEVVTPLATDAGVVFVDRGWVPLDVGDRWPTPATAPPSGRVTVDGLLAPPEDGVERASRQPSGVRIVGAIDPADLRRSFPGERVYGLHLIAEGASSSYPVPVDPPDLSDGPHLSYALQWFSFATVGIVGWGLLVSRRARRPVGADAEPREVASAAQDDDHAGGDTTATATGAAAEAGQAPAGRDTALR